MPIPAWLRRVQQIWRGDVITRDVVVRLVITAQQQGYTLGWTLGHATGVADAQRYQQPQQGDAEMWAVFGRLN
jgi:hypothetical protein